MLVQQAYYLELLPHLGPAEFSYKQTHQHAGFFLSLSEHSLGCHCKGVLFTYSLRTVRAFTKLIALLYLT
jgi:hypothetical protein